MAHYNKSPLMYAAEANAAEITKILIGAGADVNLVSEAEEGTTALVCAIKSVSSSATNRRREIRRSHANCWRAGRILRDGALRVPHTLRPFRLDTWR